MTEPKRRPRRANDSGSLIPRPGGAWLAHVSLPGGGRRSRLIRPEAGESKAQTRRRAESEVTNLLAEVRAGRTRAGATTLADYAAAWLDTERAALARGRSKRRPTTLASHDLVLRRYVLPHLGAKPLGRIGRDDVERMLDRLADQGLRAGTLRHARVTLSVVLGAAHRAGLVALPLATERVEVPRAHVERRPHVVLDAAQVAALLTELSGERWEGPVALMATLGLRRGEALGLGWSEVDLDAGRVTIRRSLVMVSGAPTLGEPKTRSGVRTLALGTAVVAVLRRWHVTQAAERLVLGAAWGAGWVEADLAFTDPIGRPLEHRPAAGQAAPGRCRGRAAACPPPRPAPHHGEPRPRHGATVHEVAEALGHTDGQMVATVYGHALPGGRDRAVAGVAAAIGEW